jgi:hypothetical protein
MSTTLSWRVMFQQPTAVLRDGDTHLSWELCADFCALSCSSIVCSGTGTGTPWYQETPLLLFPWGVLALSCICQRAFRAGVASSCRWASGPSPRDCPRPCKSISQSINQSVSQSEVLFVSNRPTFTFTVMDCIAMSQGNKESTELQTAEMRFIKSVDTYKSIHEMRNGCVHV